MAYSLSFENCLDGIDPKEIDVEIIDPRFHAAVAVGDDDRLHTSAAHIAGIYAAGGIDVPGPNTTGNAKECYNISRDRMYFSSHGIGAVVIRSIYE